MEPDDVKSDEKKLGEILEMVKENNRILRKIRRGAVVGTFLSILYWVIIIGISVGAYYYIKPYLGSFNTIIQSVGNLKI